MLYKAKRALVESAREVWGSVRVGGKNPKNMWWNDDVKAVVKRKKAAWKEVLRIRGEDPKEDIGKFTKKFYGGLGPIHRRKLLISKERKEREKLECENEE